MAVAACYAGPIEDGRRVLAPLRAFGPPAADAMGPKSYPAFNPMFDASWAPGFENYWKAEYLAGLPYGEAKFRRLQAVKRTYDPTNMFRLNQNIPPARYDSDRS